MAADLSEAIEHHRRGRLDRALALYEAALAVDSENAQALHLIGLVLLQQGNPNKAADLLERAVALQPKEAAFHASLAEAQWAIGQRERAIACGRAALALEPENPEFLCNLGSSLASVGELDPAIRYLREAIRVQSDLAPAHNNLANALRQKGQKLAAVAHLREAVRLNPALAGAHSNLGELLLDAGEITSAVFHCHEAVRLAPAFAAGHHNLGNALLALGQFGEAEASFREAIRLDPSMAAAYAGLADLLEQAGELDRSQSLLRDVLRLDPYHAGALARLATRLRDRLPDGDRTAIATLLADSRLPGDKRSKLLFGIAQVLDARGRFDEAAAALVEANALARADFRGKGSGYDRVAHRKHIDAIIAAFTPDFFAKMRGLGVETERPVFVVGLPRSGTSLCEQVLASHPQVFGAGELRAAREMFEALPRATGRNLAPLDCVQYLDGASASHLARSYIKALAALDLEHERVVDKMPENTHYLGLIAALFPGARVIHCRRDLRDVALSLWMTEFGQLRWACDIDDIAGRIEDHRRLIEHWRRVLPRPILEIDYEAMVADLDNAARTLINGCGLPWHPACLDFHTTRRAVRTPSTVSVRQPIYSTSVGRWKNYAQALAPLFANLDNNPSMAVVCPS
jgi:tetratricopeptide (TPR) repeat protein